MRSVENEELNLLMAVVSELQLYFAYITWVF